MAVTAVWSSAWTLDYPVTMSRKYDKTILDLGAGSKKIALSEVAHSRADGVGTVSSYKGTNTFTIRVRRKNYAGDAKFKAIWAFLAARWANNAEPFYFYNPAENADGDDTMTETTGRYIVQYLGDLSADMTHLNVWDFVDLVFAEATNEY